MTETGLVVAKLLPQGPLQVGEKRLLHPHPDVPEAPDILDARVWLSPKGDFKVIASIDATPHGVLRHVSLSHPGHLPSWRDVREVREALFPADIDVMMVLPRRGYYVNLHPYCFHLWQIPEKWGLR